MIVKWIHSALRFPLGGREIQDPLGSQDPLDGRWVGLLPGSSLCLSGQSMSTPLSGCTQLLLCCLATVSVQGRKWGQLSIVLGREEREGECEKSVQNGVSSSRYFLLRLEIYLVGRWGTCHGTLVEVGEQLWGSTLSSYRVGRGDWTQVIGHGCKYLYPLGHLGNLRFRILLNELGYSAATASLLY